MFLDMRLPWLSGFFFPDFIYVGEQRLPHCKQSTGIHSHRGAQEYLSHQIKREENLESLGRGEWCQQSSCPSNADSSSYINHTSHLRATWLPCRVFCSIKALLSCCYSPAHRVSLSSQKNWLPESRLTLSVTQPTPTLLKVIVIPPISR